MACGMDTSLISASAVTGKLSSKADAINFLVDTRTRSKFNLVESVNAGFLSEAFLTFRIMPLVVGDAIVVPS
jgi:hypothetical protein